MKLVDRILSALISRWHRGIHIDPLGFTISIKEFVQKILAYCIVIENLQTVYGKQLTFGLWSPNSLEFIQAYIALIIKNVDFFLIPTKLQPYLVTSLVLNSDINVLFVADHDKDCDIIKQKLKSYPGFKVIFDIGFKFKYTKKPHILNETLDIPCIDDEVSTMLSQTQTMSGDVLIEKLRLRVGHRPKYESISRAIGVFTSSNDMSVYPRIIQFEDNDILNAIDALIESDKVPNISHKTINVESDFALTSVWSILWPVMSGATYDFSNDAQILLTTGNKFEEHWNIVVKEIYEIKVIGKLLFNSLFQWLFNIIAKYKLKKYFNFHARKEAIIALNAFLPPRIKQVSTQCLPLYITYGIQEMNYVTTINDFSTYGKNRENCVGELIDNIASMSIKEVNLLHGEGSLVLGSALLSSLSTELLKGLYFDTTDHASLEMEKGSALLYIYGKLAYSIKDSPYMGSNLANLEVILKNVPYFKDVLVHKDISDTEKNIHIFVQVNTDIVEAKGFGLLDFKNYIKTYKTFINDRYGNEFIKDVKIMFTDFVRGYDGKIKKVYYQPSLTNLPEEE